MSPDAPFPPGKPAGPGSPQFPAVNCLINNSYSISDQMIMGFPNGVKLQLILLLMKNQKQRQHDTHYTNNKRLLTCAPVAPVGSRLPSLP